MVPAGSGGTGWLAGRSGRGGRSRAPGRAEVRFVLRACVLGWGLPMFAWFFTATELILPALDGRPLASPLSLLYAVALQLPFWAVSGFWFGRLLWKRLPAERRAALEARYGGGEDGGTAA